MDCDKNTFSTEDGHLRVIDEKRLKTAKEYFKICIACVVIISVFLSFKISLCLIYSEDGTYINKDFAGLVLFLILVPAFILIGYFSARFLHCRMLLKVYFHRMLLTVHSLSKIELWVINCESKTICRAKPIRVCNFYNCGKDFDTTEFVCIVEENDEKEYIIIDGDYLYFSKKSAESVLKFIQDTNSRAIEQYYPNWKQDEEFVAYYRQWQDNHTRSKYSSLSKLLIVPAVINKFEYNPNCDDENDVVIEIMIKGFIDKKKEKEHKAGKKQQIINKIREVTKTDICSTNIEYNSEV